MLQPKRLVLPTIPRREEQAQIRQALQEAQDGGVRLVFVSGQSGTGKSSLVEKALNSSTTDTSNQLWQARTKFDQRRGTNINAPLTNLRCLLSDLVASIKSHYAQAEQQECGMKSHLQNQLDPHQLQVLKSFLMDGDISSDSDSEEEEPKWDDSEQFAASNSTDTQKDAFNVLTSALKTFIRAISNMGTIVLTMDDIHWGCKITEHVIREICTDKSLHNVLVCATYRSNEDTATHGFYEWKDNLQKEILEDTPNASFTAIPLDNLKLQEVQELLAEAVSREKDDVLDLAQTIFGFTHGNLFFTKHFLEKLQDDELLTFDYNKFQWQWDTSQIKRRSSLSDNVVQALASRLQKLPKDVQSVLRLAACFGAQFDVRALEASKSALNLDCVDTCLEQAHKQEFVIQLTTTLYRFAHDMIQLAAFGLALDFEDEEDGLEPNQLHWKIGCLLMQEEELLNDDAIFFATVDHLNLGADANLSECCLEGRCRLAKANYKAGCKASKLSAFLPASRYLQAGIAAFCGNPFDEKSYDLAIQLHSLAASTEFVIGNLGESMRLCQLVWENGRCNGRATEEVIVVMRVMFDCLAAQNDVDGVLEFCFRKLKMMGNTLPRKPNTVHVQLEYQKMKSKLKSMSDEDILALPIMNDVNQQMRLGVLSTLIFPLYQKEEVGLCTLVASNMINITLKHGWSRSTSAKAFIMAATFVVAQSQDIREGYRLGQLAEKLVRRDGFDWGNTAVLFQIPTITKWWLEPAQNGLDLYLECTRIAMKHGHVNTAFQATTGYMTNYFFSGLPLEPLLQDAEKNCLQFLEYNQHLPFFLSSPCWQALLCLTGKEEKPASMDEGKVSARRKGIPNPNKTGEQSMMSYQMLLSFYLGDLPTATEMANELGKMNPGIMKASFWYNSRRFIMALVAMANYRLTKKLKDKATAERHLKYFRKVVKNGAINLVHKLLLLEAEHSTSIGSFSFPGMRQNFDDTFSRYDEAIVTASRSGFLQDAALANYLCFQFCKSRPDRMHLADMYLKRSFELWMSWGAVAVATSLVDRHKESMSDSTRNSLNGVKDSSTTSGGISVRGRARFDAKLAPKHKELNVNS